MSIEKVISQPTLTNLEQTYRKIEKRNLEIIDKKDKSLIQDKDKFERIVQGLNDLLQPANTHVKFELHEELNEYYVTVVDDQTNEIIKEIPSKKILDMYSKMTEFMGLLLDRKI